MRRIIILLFPLLFSYSESQAQHYRTAAGIRLGSEKTIGLSIQQLVYKKITLEGILQVGAGNSSLNSIIVLAEQHQKILFKRLNLYYGLGLHKSWYNNNSTLEDEFRNPSGVAAITGLELAVGKMTVSLDIQPNLNVVGGNQFLNTTTAVSLRYVLIKPKKKKRKRINWKFWERK
ncbi:MAG: hypothetical protein ACI9XB_000902 [Gammaproteobacteria bacterium]|jgi:hypothetical protein